MRAKLVYVKMMVWQCVC